MDRHIDLRINDALLDVLLLFIIGVVINYLCQFVSHADLGSLVLPFLTDFFSMLDLLVLLAHVPCPTFVRLFSSLVDGSPDVLNQWLCEDLYDKILLGYIRFHLWLIKLEIDIINFN